jgi:hypothetical protein
VDVIWIKTLKHTYKKLNYKKQIKNQTLSVSTPTWGHRLNPDGSIGQRIPEFLSSVSRETPKSPISLGIIERRENVVAKNSSLLSQGGSDLLKRQTTQENVARG